MLIAEGYIIITTASTKFRIDSFSEIEIDSTWSNLTDMCTVKMPRKFAFKNSAGDSVSMYGNSTYGNVDSLFQKGDQVEVWLGYSWVNKNNEVSFQVNNVFTGYISKITLGTLVEINAEDQMYKLKKTQMVPKHYKSVNIHELVASYLPSGLTMDRSKDATLSPFRIENETVAQLLHRLREEQKMYAFFRDNILYLGFLKYPFVAKTHEFNFNANIIADRLEYQRTDDRKLGVLCKSLDLKNGKKKLECFVDYSNGNVVMVSDKIPLAYDGEVRTIHVRGAVNRADLVDRATAELNRYNYDGFKGDFTTFGLPFFRHGDNARLINVREPEKNGLYKIKANRLRFAVEEGIRQIGTLDYKINE